MEVGFIILSHGDPEQLARLVRTLRVVHDDPPIACHHDMSRSRLDPRDFPGVAFVEPHLRTGWGKWSLVAATLAALRLLYRDANPDWFTLLSAACYPVSDGDRVRRDLAVAKADALLDYREVPLTGTWHDPPGACLSLAHHGSPQNIAIARGRYMHPIVKVPIIRREGARFGSLNLPVRLGSYTVPMPLPALGRVPGSPFRGGFRCYVGSQWFTANRRVARRINNPDAAQLRLARWLRWRVVPDEAFFQTLLCNDPAIRVDPNTRRFAEWNGGGAHPQLLDVEEALAAHAAGAHFGRKFAPGSPALDALDAVLKPRPVRQRQQAFS